MSNINILLNKIKNAIYGKDVRQSIHDAIKQTYEDAIGNGNTDMEVVNARGEFESLQAKLNDIESKNIKSCNSDAQFQIGYFYENDGWNTGLNSSSLANPGFYSLKLTNNSWAGIPDDLFSESDTSKQVLLEVKSNRTNIGIDIGNRNNTYAIRQDLYDLDSNRHWYRMLSNSNDKHFNFTEWQRIIEPTVASNAGAHNSVYRGKDITDLFYDETLSKQIAAGTFDDIFVGDYIIGKISGRKYLVADINYRLHTGDTECTTPHVLMIPEQIMETAKMNDTNITTGAYVGSKMRSEYLTSVKTTIQNDFGNNHILNHKLCLANGVTNGKPSGWAWYESIIDFMNEGMVYGQSVWCESGYNTGNDVSQLALFRLDRTKIMARNENNDRTWYWLRDVYSSTDFAHVGTRGDATTTNASNPGGIRPAFLIY